MSYIPTRPVPQQWHIQHCPHCALAIRSSKAYNMRRALAMHLSKYHRDALAPDREPVPPFKVIAIVAVHFSGSRKRLGHAFDGLKSATVPSDFPGESGVAVVRYGRVRIYERLGAGVVGYEMVERRDFEGYNKKMKILGYSIRKENPKVKTNIQLAHELMLNKAELQRTRTALDAARALLEMSDTKRCDGYDGLMCCECGEMSEHADNCEYLEKLTVYENALSCLIEL